MVVMVVTEFMRMHRFRTFRSFAHRNSQWSNGFNWHVSTEVLKPFRSAATGRVLPVMFGGTVDHFR